jgi:3-hydroxybutyryl-CoA dehydrogenase
MTEIRKIAVLGSGTMGHGIAQVAAQFGKYEVNMHDIEQRLVDKGMAMIRNSLRNFLVKGQITENDTKEILARIHETIDLKEAVLDADLIIEAVTEKASTKKALLKKVGKHTSDGTIITTNTSSISITELASATKHPQKFCGIHFFNPPQIMKLVEVTRGAETSLETIQTVSEVAHKMGKETVLVKKDCPGFIVNRILLPALNEAAEMFDEGIADRDDIDKAVKLGLNWPMGPLMLIDYIGADTTMAIAEILERKIGPRFRPSSCLKQMVKARMLGKKTGKGFYDWTQPRNDKSEKTI